MPISKTFKTVKDFLDYQNLLYSLHYELEDVNEYLGTETWSRGPRTVILCCEEDL